MSAVLPEARAAVALALGRSVEDFSFDWTLALTVARQERCAPLAWARSGEVIRQLAPPDVRERWRAEMFAAVRNAEQWTKMLERLLVALANVSVVPVVLKGLALSERLYGDPAVRPCADLDFFIPTSNRDVAHRAILDAGWHVQSGTAPNETVYGTWDSGRYFILEVHSALLDDDLVAHLGLEAPSGDLRKFGPASAIVHRDDQLPVFLAVHLAKHAMPPLLWFADFAALWEQLDAPARARAWGIARRARAQRYLRWAISTSDRLRKAADGNEVALRRLGFRDGGRTDVHNAARMMMFAASPADAFRVLREWLAPRGLYRDPRKLKLRLTRLLGKPLRYAFGRDRDYGSSPKSGHSPIDGAKSLALDHPAFAELARDIFGAGLSLWIRPSGGSMRPAIPPQSFVRLRPLGDAPLKPGDVVLANVGDDRMVLHRVVRIDESGVELRGDFNLRSDPHTSIGDVLAVADVIQMPDGIRPISRSLWTKAPARLRGLAHRVRGTEFFSRRNTVGR